MLVAAARFAPSEADPVAILDTVAERDVASFDRFPDYPDGVDVDRLRRALRAGAPVGSAWPAGVEVTFGRYTDPGDTALRDLMAGGPTGFLVSASLGEHLLAAVPDAVELLPVTLHDLPAEPWFALHVLAVPAIDLARAWPKHNLLDPRQVDDVAVHALRADAVAGRPLFRAREFPPSGVRHPLVGGRARSLVRHRRPPAPALIVTTCDSAATAAGRR